MPVTVIGLLGPSEVRAVPPSVETHCVAKLVTGLPPSEPSVNVVVAWPAPPVVPVTVGAVGAVVVTNTVGP